MRRRVVLLGALLLGTGGVACAGPPGSGDGGLVRVAKVPHVRQEPDFCGEACVSMALRARGHAVGQDAVFAASGLDPALGRGCHTAELVRAAKRLGFDVGTVWNPVEPSQPAASVEGVWAGVLADLRRGVPSVVCMKYDARPDASEHFRLITGYDPRSDEVLYHEPAEARGAYRRMPRARLLRLWPLPTGGGKRSAIRLRLKLAKFQAPPQERGHTRAAFARHVMRLRKRLPGTGFTVVVEPPFVVVGDEAPATVRRRAAGTVKWAADRLKALYFERDPEHILDVWLFRNATSYRSNAKKLFGSPPSTPFGYYSSSQGALVMNIATGGGTLVHELVHPFVANNFPGCPSWFNEGLASLYEQCGERKGRIWGFTNWRLKGLKQVIRNKRLPRFEALMKTSSRAFYDQDRGDNYAQARYLCYYLQERGLLTRFFRRFRATRKADPSGVSALKAVLKEDDLAAFQRRWEAWVLRLSFP